MVRVCLTSRYEYFNGRYDVQEVPDEEKPFLDCDTASVSIKKQYPPIIPDGKILYEGSGSATYDFDLPMTEANTTKLNITGLKGSIPAIAYKAELYIYQKVLTGRLYVKSIKDNSIQVQFVAIPDSSAYSLLMSYWDEGLADGVDVESSQHDNSKGLAALVQQLVGQPRISYIPPEMVGGVYPEYPQGIVYWGKTDTHTFFEVVQGDLLTTLYNWLIHINNWLEVGRIVPELTKANTGEGQPLMIDKDKITWERCCRISAAVEFWLAFETTWSELVKDQFRIPFLQVATPDPQLGITQIFDPTVHHAVDYAIVNNGSFSCETGFGYTTANGMQKISSCVSGAGNYMDCGAQALTLRRLIELFCGVFGIRVIFEGLMYDTIPYNKVFTDKTIYKRDDATEIQAFVPYCAKQKDANNPSILDNDYNLNFSQTCSVVPFLGTRIPSNVVPFGNQLMYPLFSPVNIHNIGLVDALVDSDGNTGYPYRAVVDCEQEDYALQRWYNYENKHVFNTDSPVPCFSTSGILKAVPITENDPFYQCDGTTPYPTTNFTRSPHSGWQPYKNTNDDGSTTPTPYNGFNSSNRNLRFSDITFDMIDLADVNHVIRNRYNGTWGNWANKVVRPLANSKCSTLSNLFKFYAQLTNTYFTFYDAIPEYVEGIADGSPAHDFIVGGSAGTPLGTPYIKVSYCDPASATEKLQDIHKNWITKVNKRNFIDTSLKKWSVITQGNKEYPKIQLRQQQGVDGTANILDFAESLAFTLSADNSPQFQNNVASDTKGTISYILENLKGVAPDTFTFRDATHTDQNPEPYSNTYLGEHRGEREDFIQGYFYTAPEVPAYLQGQGSSYGGECYIRNTKMTVRSNSIFSTGFTETKHIAYAPQFKLTEDKKAVYKNEDLKGSLTVLVPKLWVIRNDGNQMTPTDLTVSYLGVNCHQIKDRIALKTYHDFPYTIYISRFDYIRSHATYGFGVRCFAYPDKDTLPIEVMTKWFGVYKMPDIWEVEVAIPAIQGIDLIFKHTPQVLLKLEGVIGRFRCIENPTLKFKKDTGKLTASLKLANYENMWYDPEPNFDLWVDYDIRNVPVPNLVNPLGYTFYVYVRALIGWVSINWDRNSPPMARWTTSTVYRDPVNSMFPSSASPDVNGAFGVGDTEFEVVMSTNCTGVARQGSWTVRGDPFSAQRSSLPISYSQDYIRGIATTLTPYGQIHPVGTFMNTFKVMYKPQYGTYLGIGGNCNNNGRFRVEFSCYGSWALDTAAFPTWLKLATGQSATGYQTDLTDFTMVEFEITEPNQTGSDRRWTIPFYSTQAPCYDPTKPLNQATVLATALTPQQPTCRINCKADPTSPPSTGAAYYQRWWVDVDFYFQVIQQWEIGDWRRPDGSVQATDYALCSGSYNADAQINGDEFYAYINANPTVIRNPRIIWQTMVLEGGTNNIYRPDIAGAPPNLQGVAIRCDSSAPPQPEIQMTCRITNTYGPSSGLCRLYPEVYSNPFWTVYLRVSTGTFVVEQIPTNFRVLRYDGSFNYIGDWSVGDIISVNETLILAKKDNPTGAQIPSGTDGNGLFVQIRSTINTSKYCRLYVPAQPAANISFRREFSCEASDVPCSGCRLEYDLVFENDCHDSSFSPEPFGKTVSAAWQGQNRSTLNLASGAMLGSNIPANTGAAWSDNIVITRRYNTDLTPITRQYLLPVHQRARCASASMSACSIGAGGGTVGTLTITADTSLTWTISLPSWLSLGAGETLTGSGSETRQIIAAANMGALRVEAITVTFSDGSTSQTCDIDQPAGASLPFSIFFVVP